MGFWLLLVTKASKTGLQRAWAVQSSKYISEVFAGSGLLPVKLKWGQREAHQYTETLMA